MPDTELHTKASMNRFHRLVVNQPNEIPYFYIVAGFCVVMVTVLALLS